MQRRSRFRGRTRAGQTVSGAALPRHSSDAAIAALRREQVLVTKIEGCSRKK